MPRVLHVYGTIGDVDPIKYGGGVIYSEAGAGGPLLHPSLIYFDPSDDESRVAVYRMDVPDNVFEYHEWADALAIARSIGWKDSLEDYVKIGFDDDPVRRAAVMHDIAGYYGWENFDSYPLDLTEEEAEKQYGDWLDQVRTRARRAKYANPGGKSIADIFAKWPKPKWLKAKRKNPSIDEELRAAKASLAKYPHISGTGRVFDKKTQSFFQMAPYNYEMRREGERLGGTFAAWGLNGNPIFHWKDAKIRHKLQSAGMKHDKRWRALNEAWGTAMYVDGYSRE